jgi:hypothetical protein
MCATVDQRGSTSSLLPDVEGRSHLGKDFVTRHSQRSVAAREFE